MLRCDDGRMILCHQTSRQSSEQVSSQFVENLQEFRLKSLEPKDKAILILSKEIISLSACTWLWCGFAPKSGLLTIRNRAQILIVSQRKRIGAKFAKRNPHLLMRGYQLESWAGFEPTRPKPYDF